VCGGRARSLPLTLRVFEAFALGLQVALELRDALPLLGELVLQAHARLRDFIPLRSEMNTGGADHGADREHSARHECQPAQARTRDRTRSLELQLVAELPRANLLRGARFGFQPHALDFSVADCSEPRLLFAFGASTFCDLELATSRRFLSLSGEPFGRFGALPLARSLSLELGLAFALHAPALFAHE
jgi:hypothetical protein